MFDNVHLVSAALGLPPEATVYLLCLLLSNIFSLVYWVKISTVKAQWVKNLYVMAVGNLFLFMCLPALHIVQVYIPIIFTYLLTRYFPNQWWMPIVNMVVTLVHLSIVHAYFEFISLEKVKHYTVVTIPLMRIVIKLTTFAFDVFDSSPKLGKKVDTGTSSRKKSHQATTINNDPSTFNTKEGGGGDDASPTNDEYKVPVFMGKSGERCLELLPHQYPNFLEFLGYCLLFPGILAGPPAYFYQYKSLIDGSCISRVNQTRGALLARRNRLLYLLLMSLLFLTLHGTFDLGKSLSYAISPEFTLKPLWYRIVHVRICMFFAHCEYYFIWMITEASYVAMGMGFRIDDKGKPLWDQLETINPLILETYSEYRIFMSRWNKCVTEWLNLYIYNRIKNRYKNSSGLALLTTYGVSALWHGFFPGYYMTSFSAAWGIYVSRLIYKKVRWPFGNFSKWFLVTISSHLLADYINFPLCVLYFAPAFQLWKSFWFFPHLGLAILTICLDVVPRMLSSASSKKPYRNPNDTQVAESLSKTD